MQQHAADEMLLRQIVDECSKRQDTVLHLDSKRQLVVTKSINPQHCPLLDIMLRGAERGVGMCTDVALYMMYAGGRVIPMPAAPEVYDSYCGSLTARLFLESMYGEFVSKRKDVLHIQLLNSEHMWTQDAPMHAKMQLFLCKTAFCQMLMQQHVVNKRYWASVWFMGHTSSDPSVGISGDVTAQLLSAIAGNRPQGYAIHVKGKSGLKQTKVVLDCWAQHPEFPALVVVGKASKEELSPAALAAKNIIFHPPVAREAGHPEAAGADLLIEPDRLRALQTAASLHVCPSVREGFGHYLNEARAVGGLVVTVDHPPMNELITPDSGLLVPSVFTMSEKAIHAGLALPAGVAAHKRAAVAAAFRQEKAAFLHRMGQLKVYLENRTAVAAAAAAGTSTAAAQALAAGLARVPPGGRDNGSTSGGGAEPSIVATRHDGAGRRMGAAQQD
eukprot:gene12551-12684_t